MSKRLAYIVAAGLLGWGVLPIGLLDREGELTAVRAAEGDWSHWRGPAYNGHAPTDAVPVKWSDASIVWKSPLEGEGQSSPVVWDDRIFLTTALDGGKQRVVLCINRVSGKRLWTQVAWTGTPEATHKMNGHASATCATDGERVFAFFGRGGGLHCYSVDGEKLWSHDLGEFRMETDWGTAAAPVLFENLVIQNCDADFDARLVAIDKATGKLVWETPRENHRGWSTPILAEIEGETQLIVNGHTGVRAYHPQTGKELWYCESFNGRGEPTVTLAGELLHVVNGLSGDTYAIKPGGKGNITAQRRVWHTSRSGRDLPSPIVVNGHVLVVGMRGGVLTCYRASDGRELWKERLGDNYAASPVAAGDLAFLLNESGHVTVVRPGPKPEIVTINQLTTADDEIFRGSMAASHGQWLIRSNRFLYCIGE